MAESIGLVECAENVPGVHQHRLSVTERQRKKDALIAYLLANPDAKARSIVQDGHGYAFKKLYRGRLNLLRMKNGIEPRYVNDSELQYEYRERKRQEMLNYMRAHPKAGRDELKRHGFSSTIKLSYGERINEARRDAGLPPRGRGGNNNPLGR